MARLTRRGLLIAATGATVAVAAGVGTMAALLPAAQADVVVVHKTPWCGCCGAWVEHLRANGFEVSVEEHDDLAPIKAKHGVPGELQSCHTALVDGYVVEGHVPGADIRRLLEQRPQAAGLAVPGMPIGSPGMEQGNTREPYAVMLFGGPQMTVWSRH